MRIVLSALILCFSTFLSATTLNKMIVFGDSLSDNGNFYEHLKHQVPKSPPYYEGRFSNGPVWVELLVASYFPENSKAHLMNYAVAGAAVVDDDDEPIFTLRSEVDSFMRAHQNVVDPNDLYVLWIGANNYLGDPDNIEQSVADVNAGIKSTLQRLADKGAKYILVLNLPDLGRIPEARVNNTVSEWTMLSEMHNALLLENVEALKKSYPSVQWLYYDVKSALDEMLTNPARNGFTNVTDSCYEAALDELTVVPSVIKIAATININSANAGACDGFLFFDPVHPSALAHRIMAEKTRELLDNAGITFM